MENNELFCLDNGVGERATNPQPPRHTHEPGDQCAVCLSKGEDTMLLPCAHQFHGKCILRWVEQNYSCPLCRQEINQFVPLSADNPEIHQKFVEIWERHHYGSPSDSECEDDPTSGPGGSDAEAKDRFDASKPKEVLASEVQAIEEAPSEDEKEPVDDEMQPDVDEETLQVITERVSEVVEEEVEVELDEPPTPQRISFLALPSPGLALAPLEQDPVVHVSRRLHEALRALPEALRGLVPERETRPEDRTVARFSFPIPRVPTAYRLNESLEAGFLAGGLTAGLLATLERPTNLYPLVRTVVPNVAIFFTVYEDLKFRSLSGDDSSQTSFLKRTACAGTAATLGQLPHNRFKLTVPLRFGLQFGFFELFKDRLCELRNYDLVDHSLLNPMEIGLAALSGGVLAASAAFPLEIYMGYMAPAEQTMSTTYRTFMKRFLPGCVFTALSFEFGRRWIHNNQKEPSEE